MLCKVIQCGAVADCSSSIDLRTGEAAARTTLCAWCTSMEPPSSAWAVMVTSRNWGAIQYSLEKYHEKSKSITKSVTKSITNEL